MSRPAPGLMLECIELARRGRGAVEPNPMVGALVVRDGRVVGRGYHASWGGPHAEVHALREAGEAARGADLYVTLEPCSTSGKTPPCTEAILRAGIARVFIGVDDPNERHAGAARGVLERAGVAVTNGVLEEEAKELLAGFRAWLEGSQPFVLVKWASTLDGRIATRTGDSRWITGRPARARVHEERARADAIMVGIGTVLADDPRLTVRHVEGGPTPGPTPPTSSPHPRRVVLDAHLRTPPGAALLHADDHGALIVTAPDPPPDRAERLTRAGARLLAVPTSADGRLDLASALAALRAEGLHRVMVEGGARVLGSLLHRRLVDFVEVHLAPRILGDAQGRPAVDGGAVPRMSDTLDLIDPAVERVGNDVIVRGALTKSCS